MATLEGTRASAEFMVRSVAPDFCKSPSIIVGYQIVSFFNCAVNFSSNVRFRKQWAFRHNSRLSTVIGNEQGVGGGIASQVNKGFCRPIDGTSSTTVKVNGAYVDCHEKTYMYMNCAGPEGQYNTVGRVCFLGNMLPGPVAPSGKIPKSSFCGTSDITQQMQDLMGSDIEGLVKKGQMLYDLAVTVLAEIKAANDKALAEARQKERQEAERAAAEKAEADRLAAEQANLNDLEGDLDVPEKTQAELNQFYQDKIGQIDKQLENENLSTKARQQLLDERKGWKSEINDPSEVVLNGDIPLDEEEIAEFEQQKRDSLRDEQAESAKNDFGKADYLERHGNRLARQAELAHIIGDDETEERLRKESQRLKLEAATIRDGERGSINEQKQIEAGNLMRSFLDLADKGADGLPRQVKEFYDWAKIPIRDGLPQITEEVVDLEQRFHQWLKER